MFRCIVLAISALSSVIQFSEQMLALTSLALDLTHVVVFGLTSGSEHTLHTVLTCCHVRHKKITFVLEQKELILADSSSNPTSGSSVCCLYIIDLYWM